VVPEDLLLAPQLEAEKHIAGLRIDIDAETRKTEKEDLANLVTLPLARPAGRERQATGKAGSIDDVLPHDCLGSACDAKFALQDLVRRCGDNRDCWEKELRRPKV
jgi:hypothetical protein